MWRERFFIMDGKRPPSSTTFSFENNIPQTKPGPSFRIHIKTKNADQINVPIIRIVITGQYRAVPLQKYIPLEKILLESALEESACLSRCSE